MNRIEQEKEHGKKILEEAEFFWGWGTPAGKERLRRRVEWIIREGRLAPGTRTLELGCGKGLYSRKLVESGTGLVAIDISSDLLEAGKQADPRTRYLVADGHGLPFLPSVFDAVVGVSVIHHLELTDILEESYRVLKTGGRFVFSEPNMLNPQIAIQKNIPLIKRWLGDSPEETAFLKWRLRRKLEGIGFRNVRIVPFDFLHPWTPEKIIGRVDAFGRWLEKIPLLREIAGSLFILAEK